MPPHKIPDRQVPDLGPGFEQDPETGKWRRKTPPAGPKQAAGERGGPKGPEPTRYNDWEKKGIVSDF